MSQNTKHNKHIISHKSWWGGLNYKCSSVTMNNSEFLLNFAVKLAFLSKLSVLHEGVCRHIEPRLYIISSVSIQYNWRHCFYLEKESNPFTGYLFYRCSPWHSVALEKRQLQRHGACKSKFSLEAFEITILSLVEDASFQYMNIHDYAVEKSEVCIFWLSHFCARQLAAYNMRVESKSFGPSRQAYF
jgi:hypothetical protein